MELAEALLCSYVFLTSRHARNEDTKGLPEPELFAVILAKRLELIGWLEQAPRADVGRVLNTVLRTATGVEEAPAAWAVWPEKANRGRCVSLPTALPSMDGRLPVHGSFRDTVPGIEVNLQALAFRMEGNQMQAMDEEAAQDEDVLHILGTGAKTMQCISLGDFERRKDRKVVGTDYVISFRDGEKGGPPEVGIADFFESIRVRYYVKLTCKCLDVQWYLPEQTVPEDCHVVDMAGSHPEKPSIVGKEVLIFKEQMCCQVFGVETQGRCKYRVLEFTTDMRFAM